MMLGEIRDYLRKRKTASLGEISAHFDISREGACFALDYWIEKGKVSKTSAACGSSCNSCSSSDEGYQWIEVEHEIKLYKML